MASHEEKRQYWKEKAEADVKQDRGYRPPTSFVFAPFGFTERELDEKEVYDDAWTDAQNQPRSR